MEGSAGCDIYTLLFDEDARPFSNYIEMTRAPKTRNNLRVCNLTDIKTQSYVSAGHTFGPLRRATIPRRRRKLLGLGKLPNIGMDYGNVRNDRQGHEVRQQRHRGSYFDSQTHKVEGTLNSDSHVSQREIGPPQRRHEYSPNAYTIISKTSKMHSSRNREGANQTRTFRDRSTKPVADSNRNESVTIAMAKLDPLLGCNQASQVGKLPAARAPQGLHLAAALKGHSKLNPNPNLNTKSKPKPKPKQKGKKMGVTVKMPRRLDLCQDETLTKIAKKPSRNMSVETEPHMVKSLPNVATSVLAIPAVECHEKRKEEELQADLAQTVNKYSREEVARKHEREGVGVEVRKVQKESKMGKPNWHRQAMINLSFEYASEKYVPTQTRPKCPPARLNPMFYDFTRKKIKSSLAEHGINQQNTTIRVMLAMKQVQRQHIS